MDNNSALGEFFERNGTKTGDMEKKRFDNVARLER